MLNTRLIVLCLSPLIFSTSILLAQERDQPPKAEQDLYDQVYRIGKMGADGARFVPQLLSLLEDKATPTEVRQECLCSISKIGASAKSAIPALVKCLKEEDENIRSWSLKALRSMGTEARQEIGAVVKCLQDSNETVCRQAIFAAKAIDGDSDSVKAELRKVETSTTRSEYTKKLAAESASE